MSKSQTFSFQTEVKSLLQLMIHSLYSNKDIFLRELISNASDACDKLRFLSVATPALMAGDENLQITVDYDEKAQTISVKDNGIGMSYENVIENLGTIAKSGTKEFIDALSKEQSKEAHLIGQFGVGFYSAFMVAEKVTVLTRKAGLPVKEGVMWQSKGEGDFLIEYKDIESRGTEIILKLRSDAKEYLNHYRLQQIIHQYSDHILFPIYLREENEKEAKFNKINSQAALWTRSKSEITEQEYQDFYHHVSHDYQDALDWLHFQVEGKLQYTALLYIPKMLNQNLLMRDNKHGLKLFIERVFIMDNAELLPNYLRFIKGVLDSNDLPLNISREILQMNPLTEKIKSGLTKKILQFLLKLSESSTEKYSEFWEQFGVILKEGIAEDFENQKEIATLLRFTSSTSGQRTCLKDYIARMQQGQKGIYYIIADTLSTAQNRPHLEIFKKKGIEVLLLTDRVDEWMMAYLNEFGGQKFLSIAKGNLDLEDSKTEEKTEQRHEAEFASLIESLKKVLSEEVASVRLSKRLTDSPVCLVAEEGGLSLHLQRMMQEAGQMLPATKPILELNADHALVEKILSEQDEEKVAEWGRFLYDQALLAEGGTLRDPALFIKRVNQFVLS